MATKKKAKAPKRKPVRKSKKAAAPQTSVVKSIYNLVQPLNFGSDYNLQNGGEVVNIYPKNAHAERIIVRQTNLSETTTELTATRISGGTDYDILHVVVAKGSKTEASAAAVIKSELKRFC